MPLRLSAQDRTVQNRPYTDLRPFHFGVIVGTHLQDIELRNVGPQTITYADGTTAEALVTTEQSRWDPGINVGVLGEFRLHEHFQLRIAPTMYFGARHIVFHDLLNVDNSGRPAEVRQAMKSAMEVGLGCDFYLPFFKLRPELKFVYGLGNALDTNHYKDLRDKNMLKYAQSVDDARQKMIVLNFYFE